MSSNVFESIMQGLTEAAEHQQGKVKARTTKLTTKCYMIEKTPKNVSATSPRRPVAAAAVL